ncbi:MAG TPA: MBL fold metallo-hydrolase [Vicinamibacterales bacterium]|nr:MBL fold metallo-hydrolase [Vicinamibacterales bacterium]
MIFKQFYLNCLAHASYLIGDETTRTAVVVDPRRDVQQYLDEAESHGLTIRHVFLTHFHADFVAGHLELRDLTGATIHLGAKAQAEYAFTPMKHGDRLDLGGVRLEVLETPGHTAESISVLVYDLGRDRTRPHAVLTGDTLFVGDVGRPDLRASLGWSATDLGRLLYQSVRDRLLPLPDDTLVYPAHGAGSLCGKKISKDTVSTIGEQRRTNYALQPMSEEAFVALVTADQPDAPSYFTYDAVLNAKEHTTLEDVLERELRPLPLASVLEMIAKGAQPLDVRDPRDFAQGHLSGSINIGLNGQYATWAGTLLDRNRPIVIVASPGHEAEAAVRLGRIGFDNVAGYLEKGMHALDDRDDLLAYMSQTSAASIGQWLGEPDEPFVLDVRTPNEWQQRHLEGSTNIPLNRLTAQLDKIPRNRPIVVMCAGGYRSSIAGSLLQRAGFTRLTELTGGMGAIAG